MDGVWEKLEIWVLYECDRTALILIWRSYLRLLGHRIGQFTVVRDPRLNLRSAVCSDAHHRVKETRDRTDMIQSGGEGGQAIHIGIANMSGDPGESTSAEVQMCKQYAMFPWTCIPQSPHARSQASPDRDPERSGIVDRLERIRAAG